MFSTANKGFAKRVRAMKDDLKQAVQELSSLAGKLGISLSSRAEWPDTKKAIDAAVFLAESSLSEAKIMHNIMRDKRTALTQRQSHVDKELEKYRAEGSKSHRTFTIHDAIRAKAHEFNRA